MDNDDLNSVSATQTAVNPETAEAQALSELKKQVDVLTKKNNELQEAKSKYYDAVLNGVNPVESAQPAHRAVQEIRDDMIKGFENNITNLDYCKLAVELDDAVREDAEKRGKRDSAFLPHGEKVQVTVDEYNTAEKMNSVLKECIAAAGDDPTRFNLELKAHMSKR